MRRSLLLTLILSLALSACMPTFLQQAVNPTPVVDVLATATVLGATSDAQTLAVLPTATLVPSETPPPPPATSTKAPTAQPTSTLSADAAANLTGTAAPVLVAFSETPTLGVRYFGTIPPLVPSGRVIMINRSHAEAYVSFQCINQEGTLSILEYPVGRWMERKIPSGNCKYVAWVGGREFVGKISVDTGGQKKMVFFIDRIMIK
ncbi:MAG TPA: hypothetical protein VIV15_08865 [Anaerolineales bacterium]